MVEEDTWSLWPGLQSGEAVFSGYSIVLQDLNKHSAWGTHMKDTFPSQCLEPSRKLLLCLPSADPLKPFLLLAASTACSSTVGPWLLGEGGMGLFSGLCLDIWCRVGIPHLLLHGLHPAQMLEVLEKYFNYPFEYYSTVRI